MPKDTKEKILNIALDMFSERGYEGTNLREIAQSLGYVKSSLYRHYKSKDEILDELIKRMEAYYYERMSSDDIIKKIPSNGEELKNMTLAMIKFTSHDEEIKKMRKLLFREQFRNESLKMLASKHFYSGINERFCDIFRIMSENGILKNGENPELLALIFSSPITVLLHEMDRFPEKEEELLSLACEHIDNFCKLYFEERRL